MSSIQPIETRYNGYRFRSRLEARWAVFFDTLGVRYEYEKEGYELGELGYYLPDFWLPVQQLWVEIKGKAPTDEEVQRLLKLAGSVQWCDAILFSGPIPAGSEQARIASSEWPVIWSARYVEHSYFPNICARCGGMALSNDYQMDLLCGCGRPIPDYSRLNTAYVAARSARFEYGER